MKLAIIGVTGMVGREMLEVLSERGFFLTELIPVASEKSQGKTIIFKEKQHQIISLEEALNYDVDLVLFSAGGEVSKIWAPKFSAKGIKVIDNSSFWRMKKNIPLVIPEVNGINIKKSTKIIANPNCSTIQLAVALNEIHQKFDLKRIVIST